MTLHELAAEYGVSAERIRQIEVAAMKKMRKALAEYAEVAASLPGLAGCFGRRFPVLSRQQHLQVGRQRLGALP
jgi:hypothetical protein